MLSDQSDRSIKTKLKRQLLNSRSGRNFPQKKGSLIMQKLDNYEDEIYTLKANIDIEKERYTHSSFS